MFVQVPKILPEGNGCSTAGPDCLWFCGVTMERSVYMCTRYYCAFGLSAFCNKSRIIQSRFCLTSPVAIKGKTRLQGFDHFEN